MTTAERTTGYRIFEGANGYYVAWQDANGFHRAGYETGARHGFDREAAERELADLQDEDSRCPAERARDMGEA